jgi:multiple sugar transport system ATP-binding protein
MKLVLEKIRKVYRNSAIGVDDISLQINDGQMAVLLGPSGCGKTTLLRLISGLETPDGGSIILDGREITDWEPKSRDIAMVFQNYALYPHMSVAENLEFGLRSRKIPKTERAQSVKWAAGLLGLNDLLSRKPKELSGGQRQRVALGRAIVRKPRLYLYDEPLSNLDAELRMRMRGEILALHRRVNGTSIYVTHDQVEAMSLADIIFIMKDGKIIAGGTPKELYENPPNLFVAGFLGFPAMNLLDGSIDNELFTSSNGLKIELKNGPVLSAGRHELSAAGEISLPSNTQVVLGIRPEDISIADDGYQAGEVVSIENLGRNVLLLINTPTDDRIKLVAHGNFHIGDNIRVVLSTSKIYLFDKTSGKRIG